MIKYKLICKNCDLSFDSWFASNQEFEKLKKKNFLNCHNCNSRKIEKTLMAPTLINRSQKDKVEQKNPKILEINKKIKKGIYGTASQTDIKELKEEGINTEIIPWIEDKNN